MVAILIFSSFKMEELREIVDSIITIITIPVTVNIAVIISSSKAQNHSRFGPMFS